MKSNADFRKFQHTIKDYYAKAGRHNLPWRQTRDPYRILVSEVMLQQTQVPRVLKKYEEFLAVFPTVEALANGATADLLRVWQGLGYNRRALALKRAAETVVREHGGSFPRTKEALENLPGVGPSTSGGILAYAFDIPTTFIETNIRSVFIHHFFPEQEKKARDGEAKIHDRDLLPLVEQTLDTKNPRDWYYALMDYGVYLKQTLPNPSRRSKHHAKQSSFKGSNREVRSNILKFVLKKPATEAAVVKHIGTTDHDVKKNLVALVAEGFIARNPDGTYRVV